MKKKVLIDAIGGENAKSVLGNLYGMNDEVIKFQRERYIGAVNNYCELFGDDGELNVFTAAGRTEIGGNHTDHNLGKVLAGSVNLDAIAIAERVDSSEITLKSDGYEIIKIDIRGLEVVEEEKNTSYALIRGVCAKVVELGYEIGGFNAYVTSNVLKGSGLSSSAAFEVLMITILNHLYCDGKIDNKKNAQIAQYAENVYFGKPSGLMDQMASAVGGIITIDFKEKESPVVEEVKFDFAESGLALVIVDTGGDHADLTGEYASIAIEMKAIAKELGYTVLRETTLEKVLENAAMLREKVNDRAILRAIHYFEDNKKVEKQVAALRDNDTKEFLSLVNDSGISSWTHLQNCLVNATPKSQTVTLALGLSKQFLGDNGVCRVHGGGFAGTIQVFVKKDFADTYIEKMAKIYGKNACYKLNIRPIGTGKVDF